MLDSSPFSLLLKSCRKKLLPHGSAHRACLKAWVIFEMLLVVFLKSIACFCETLLHIAVMNVQHCWWPIFFFVYINHLETNYYNEDQFYKSMFNTTRGALRSFFGEVIEKNYFCLDFKNATRKCAMTMLEPHRSITPRSRIAEIDFLKGVFIVLMIIRKFN